MGYEMISSKLSDANTLTVSSSYDSGVHTGFHLGLQKDGEYTVTTLDKILSKEQILGLEAMLLATAKMYLKEEAE